MDTASDTTRAESLESNGQQPIASDSFNGSELKPEQQGQPKVPVRIEVPSQVYTQPGTAPELKSQAAAGQTTHQTGLEDTASMPVPVPPSSALASAVRASGSGFSQPPMPAPVTLPEPVVNSNRAEGYVDTYQYPQPENIASTSMAGPSSTQHGDAMSELQNRANLAASRVRLLDATIDILVTTFKNKYALDKGLEKRCAKFLDAAELETGDKMLRNDLEILAGSSQWVKDNLETLESCLREKHRNVQIAGPLVDAKHERKKEDKQIRAIQEVARKIQKRAVRREEAEMRLGGKASEAKTVKDAWNQLPPADGQGSMN